jgi:hypothetical protein
MLIAGTAIASEYVYTSINSGATWTAQTALGQLAVLGVTSSADGTKLAVVGEVSAQARIYISTNSGVNWTPGDTLDTWNRIASSADGSKLVAVSTNTYPRTASYTVTGGTLTTVGAITAGGDVTAFSDVRLKHKISTIDSALGRISNLRGVYYERIDMLGRKTGLIAQEVEGIMPEVVQTGTDPDGTKSIAYGNLVGLLVEGIKELTQRCSDLEKRLEDK